MNSNQGRSGGAAGARDGQQVTGKVGLPKPPGITNKPQSQIPRPSATPVRSLHDLLEEAEALKVKLSEKNKLCAS